MFKELLLKHGYRVTKPRIALYRALKRQTESLTLAELHRKTKDVERTSVYRTLQLFQKLHIVNVIPYGWKQRYELAEPYAEHHHHLVCDACGKVIEVNSEHIEALVEMLSAQAGFAPTGHHFEVRGRCEGCA